MDQIQEQQQIVHAQAARASGGPVTATERQHAQGKKTARERINLLLDANSFTEIDRLATSPILPQKLYTDGVVTGFGTIKGRRIAVFAQDFTIKGGSLGKQHAAKICKVMDMAAKVGCPIIGIYDSGGARIDEGIHALAGYGQIMRRNCQLSGVIPQISLVLGPCAGGAVYSPALTDFIFMVEPISQMFITGPQVIAEVMHQTITKEALGGSAVHTEVSGVAHDVSSSEEECFAKVKALLEYLPLSYLDEVPARSQPEHTVTPAKAGVQNKTPWAFNESLDPGLRRDDGSPMFGNHETSHIVPTNHNQAYDIKDVITDLVDPTFPFAPFFELQSTYATNIITGFARMGGMSIGIVANQPAVKAGTIDIDASVKAARFIRFCDSFGIPLVSLVDTPGYLPGVEQEHNGIIKHGAKLLYAYATATVPKITLILRKAFGGAYIVMGSKELGADFNFAWPNAHIAVLGAKAAVTIMQAKKLAAATPDERAALQQQLEAEYSKAFLNPMIAAENGYIDDIIEPAQTRERLIRALEITRDKVEKLPARKHGNMPL